MPDNTWIGTPVNRDEILRYLDRITEHYQFNRIHYIFATARFRRNVEMECHARIVWITEGSYLTQASFNGVFQEREVKAGDIMLCGPGGWDQVTARCEGNINGFSLVFHLHHIRLVQTDITHGRLNYVPFYHTGAPASGITAALIGILNAILHETHNNRDNRCHGLIRALLEQVRLDVCGESEELTDACDQMVMQMQDYIQHHYHLPISCSTVCEALGVNRSVGSTAFRRKTGKTMKVFLRELRMQLAVKLLNDPDLKVEQVARRCSYHSVSYFIKVFQDFYGVSPGEFRQHQLDKDLWANNILNTTHI